MRDNGRITICMARESTHGRMERSMKENTWKRRKKAMEYSCGQMARSMRDSGRTASSTVKDYTQQLMGKPEKVFGVKEKELNG